MKRLFPSMNGQQKLMALAIALGVIAAFIGTPDNHHSVKLNLSELGREISDGHSAVQVQDLADWIIKGKYDYRLIDLRVETAYLEYSIPTSENISASHVIDTEWMENEKLILYAEDGTAAAQTWALLKATGHKSVYVLGGGMKEWKDNILFPVLADHSSTVQKTEFEKSKEVAKYFGGHAQTGSTTQMMPELQVLKSPVKRKPPMQSKTRKKKKREGC